MNHFIYIATHLRMLPEIFSKSQVVNGLLNWRKVCFVFGLTILLIDVSAQEVTDSTSIYTIIKSDGHELVGKIISMDAREVMLLTENLGEIIIPKHEISEIIKEGFNSITGLKDQVFATRYFLTTNGLPVEKGESYIQYSLFGPDFQFGVEDRFGVGIMTSWLAVPIIANFKFTIPLAKKLNLGVGTLIATGSWAASDWVGALPFTALTYGDRSANINFSFGYGAAGELGYIESRALFSTGGMVGLGDKVSFVFDAILVPSKTITETDGFDEWEYESSGFALIMPGIRFHTKRDRAFQFGFSGIRVDGESISVPTLMWYRKFK